MANPAAAASAGADSGADVPERHESGEDQAPERGACERSRSHPAAQARRLSVGAPGASEHAEAGGRVAWLRLVPRLPGQRGGRGRDRPSHGAGARNGRGCAAVGRPTRLRVAGSTSPPSSLSRRSASASATRSSAGRGRSAGSTASASSST